MHSSKEHFHAYLQSLDVERGGLPEQFSERLLNVLRHYGVEDLERTPELEQAVFRIFLAQQRSAPEIALASALLGRWIDEPTPTGPLAGEARALLERLGRATQLRFPVVGDLARSVRFRWFDQPPVDAERADVLAAVRDELAALAADGSLSDHAERIEALAAIPEQIVRFLAERLEGGVPAKEPMLEVLVRRHYRDFDLHDLRAIENGRPFVVADYTLDDRPTQVVSTVGTMPSSRTPPETSPARSTPTSRSVAATTRPSSTSTCTGPRLPSRPTNERAAPAAGRRAALRRRRTPGVGRGLRRRQATGRTTSRSGPTSRTASPRTT